MKKLILVILIFIGIYLSFRFLLPLLLPFVIAGIVSVIYYPFLRRIYKNSDIWVSKNKKWILVLSVVLLYVVLLLSVGAICYYLMGQCQSIWLNFPFYQARVLGVVRDCCEYTDSFLRLDNGESYAYVENMIDSVEISSLTGIIPKVTSYSMQAAGMILGVVFEVVITVMATFFMIQDYEQIRSKMLETEWGKGVCRMIAKCKSTLKTYLQAQGLIMLLDGAWCTLVFFLVKQPYFLVLGPLVGLIDALPVLGAGAILIPCAIYWMIVGEIGKAFAILIAYVGCIVIRQTTEPKMIGNEMGIRPLFTLVSMYVGFQLFGVIGFLLGPVGVLIGQEIYKCCNEKWIHDTNKEVMD
ncbi:MAG: AI-2E family transporter [Lachnospiraceae bacterium]|nr:AI-2E family transporter [Lachnospiraceae bacterium]